MDASMESERRPATQPEAEYSPRALAEAGYLAFYEGRLADAQRIFGGLRLLVPDEALPLLGLAECALAAGALERAHDLARTTSRMPSCDLHILLLACWVQAQVAMRQGNSVESRRICTHMRELDPDGPWIHEFETLSHCY
jgi:hypothetical protein